MHAIAQSSESLAHHLPDFIGRNAAPGSKFDIYCVGSTIGSGTWSVVEGSKLTASCKIKIPSWFPVYGGREFTFDATAEILSPWRGKVTIGGTAQECDLSRGGRYLEFKGLDLHTLTNLSLERHKEVETLLCVKSKLIPLFWVYVYLVPKRQGVDSTQDMADERPSFSFTRD